MNEFDEIYLESGMNDELEYFEPMVESATIALDKAIASANFISSIRKLEDKKQQIACFESGDDDALWSYYESGEGGLMEKIKNALLAAWKKLKELIQTIKSIFIKNKKEEIQPSDTVVVKKPFAVMVKKIKSIWSSAKVVILKGKTKLKEDHKFQALIALLTAATVGGVILALKSKNKEAKPAEESKFNNSHHITGDTIYKKSDMEEISGAQIEQANEVIKDIQDTIETVTDKQIGVLSEPIDITKKTPLALPMFDEQDVYELQSLANLTKLNHELISIYNETRMRMKQRSLQYQIVNNKKSEFEMKTGIDYYEFKRFFEDMARIQDYDKEIYKYYGDRLIKRSSHELCNYLDDPVDVSEFLRTGKFSEKFKHLFDYADGMFDRAKKIRQLEHPSTRQKNYAAFVEMIKPKYDKMKKFM